MQGTDTVASMVVWEDGKMKKSDYRKFIIRGGERNGGGVIADRSAAEANEPGEWSSASVQVMVTEIAADVPAIEAASAAVAAKTRKNIDDAGRQNDDFASMREAVTRRYRRILEEKRPMPSLILIDGGIGQLHAAAQALESLQIINQPLASIAKKEEILYIYGQENEPCKLDRHSPVLHLIQRIRDETHRFAVTFHRLRRAKRQTVSALSEVPGVGPRTALKLLREFGSVNNIQRAGIEQLSAVVPRKSAERILAHLQSAKTTSEPALRESSHEST
jgi:excinuclease UvrABC nuclease subunit